MDKKELLKPRYKVIAYYPECPYKVGEILTKWEDWKYPDEEVYGNVNDGVDEREIIKSTVNFKLLQWWEERSEKDMPEYVRLIIDLPYYDLKKGDVQKLKRIYRQSINYWCADLVGYPKVSVSAIEPATKEEYHLNLNAER